MWFLKRFIKDIRGAIAVEYSVMLALILMVILAAVGLVGSKSSSMWGDVSTSIESLE